MAAIALAEEYKLVVEAIQTLTSTGQSIVSFNIADMSVSYQASQLPQLRERQIELSKILNARNIRKRTIPDFTA